MAQATRKLVKSSAPHSSLWWRMVLALSLVAVLALSVGVCATATRLLPPEFLGTAGQSVYGFTADLSNVERFAFVLGSGAAAVISAVLLLRLVASPEPRVQRHVLAADETGFVLVENQAVEAIAVAAAVREPGVVEATVKVYSHTSGNTPVRLSVSAGVHPGAPIDAIGRGIRTRCKDAVEGLVGLPVRNVTVSVYVMDADELIRVF